MLSANLKQIPLRAVSAPQMVWRPISAHSSGFFAGGCRVYKTIGSRSAFSGLSRRLRFLDTFGRFGCGQHSEGGFGEDGTGGGLVHQTHSLSAGRFAAHAGAGRARPARLLELHSAPAGNQRRNKPGRTAPPGATGREAATARGLERPPRRRRNGSEYVPRKIFVRRQRHAEL